MRVVNRQCIVVRAGQRLDIGSFGLHLRHAAAAVIMRAICARSCTPSFPRVPIIVDAQGDMQEASDRLTSVGASTVVGNSAQAMEEIARLRQPLIQGVQKEEEVATAREA